MIFFKDDFICHNLAFNFHVAVLIVNISFSIGNGGHYIKNCTIFGKVLFDLFSRNRFIKLIDKDLMVRVVPTNRGLTTTHINLFEFLKL